MPAEVLTLEIPCSTGGLNSMQTIGNFPVEDLRTAENLTYEDDTWRKEGGSAKINTTVITDTPSILGLHDFWPDSSTQKRIAATSDGKIIVFDVDGIHATLTSGLTNNKMTVFVEALGASTTRKLFSFNGADAVKVTSNGVTLSTISNPPTDWATTNQPVAGVSHNGRLWGFGNANYPHTVYYSVLTDHEDFKGSGSGTIRVYPGEGEKLIGGIDFAGRLYLFKYPRGIYYIDDSDTSTSNWLCKKLTSSVGLASPLAIAQTDNDVLFLSAEGLIYSLMSVQEYGEAASVKTSAILPEKIGNYIRENMSMTRIQNTTACYYGYKHEWHLAYSQKGSTYNNRRLVLDLHNIAIPRFRVSTKDICQAMAISRDDDYLYRPMVGDNAGFVRFIDESTRSKDGIAYTGKFETADVALVEKGIRRANLLYVEAVFKPLGDHNLTLDVYRDGTFSETVALNMGATGGILGSFVLGTDKLGGGNVKNTRARIVGDCRRVRFVGYNAGVAQDFSISSLIVGYSVGNERV